jgi:ribose transport system ATP-binding protein
VADNYILRAVQVSKAYPGVQALDKVDFDLRQGEVHALVGQNGAGKSTFIEIIAGSLTPDSGRIILEGKDLTQFGPSQSIDLGIQTVHQDNQLVEELSVAENIYLYDLPINRFGLIQYAECGRRTEKLLQELGLHIKPDAKLADLSFIEKKLVSIAKARSRKAKILILDEPTASLDDHGREVLFDMIRRNVEKGLSVIYISHNLGEIFEVCDRVTVFKDGKLVATHAVDEISLGGIVKEMIGQSSESLYHREITYREEQETLEVVNYSRRGVVEDVSFSVKRGEIFGLAGLVGSGRTELARMMFGIDPKDSGMLKFAGGDITPESPFDAIKKGIGYLTEERKDDGLILGRPVFENVSLARLAKSGGLIMDLLKENKDAKEISRQLDIKTPSVNQRVINLSGGNQQKVVLGKWLYAGSEVLIVDEPTVGVDVGAKGEIYRMMDDLAKEGKVIIMISSDNPELIGVCDRVGIMRGGRLAVILEGDEITEENLLRYSIGAEEEIHAKA